MDLLEWEKNSRHQKQFFKKFSKCQHFFYYVLQQNCNDLMFGPRNRTAGSREQLVQLLDQPMYLRNAGRSVAIGLDVPAVNLGERFGPQADRVRLGLAAAMTMRSWWEKNVQALEQVLAGHGSK